MTVLAVISFALGIIAAGPLSIALLTGRTKPGPGHIIYFFLVFIAAFLPCLLYIFAAFHIRRFEAWAVIFGIVTATIHGAAALVGIIGMLVALRSVGPYVLVPASAGAIVLTAALWTIRQLTQTLRQLHEMPQDQRAAFAPIMRSRD